MCTYRCLVAVIFHGCVVSNENNPQFPIEAHQPRDQDLVFWYIIIKIDGYWRPQGNAFCECIVKFDVDSIHKISYIILGCR